VQVFEYQLNVGGNPEYYEARLIRSGEDEVLTICRNITERTLLENQLKYLSLHDALTGLYNRTFFEEELRRLEKQREGSVGLLICDVDGLKIVNDSLGHDAGDSILKTVAGILRQSFRAGDVIARIGGDEFVVLVITNPLKTFEHATHRFKQRISAHNADSALPISLSWGYAISANAPPDMAALFKEADNIMFRKKLKQKQNARSAIVQGWVRALETRDFITDGHAERLEKLMEFFLRKLGLSERILTFLKLFAHFHDIGKVGIPDDILFKADTLNAKEWTVMRQHPEIGHRIAMSTPDLTPIADWILWHQEWWNGNGYPSGLKYESIPLECRMFSIIDAYDAMTHDRPYRKAMEREAALAEIRRGAGTQFDPVLVDEFVSMLANPSFQEVLA
jgi:diguanylate cyclase (GGDEF)-like protein